MSLGPKKALQIISCLWEDRDHRWRKYGFRYGPAHVVKLQSMLERHVHIPFEFTCFSDYEIPGVRTLPMWSYYRELGRCWRRVYLFSEEFGSLIGGRYVQLDVGCVILRDITPLLERTEEFVILHQLGPSQHDPLPRYQGTFWMSEPGARSQLWDDFDPETSPGLCAHLTGSDQAWIRYKLRDEATWEMSDGVANARINEPTEETRIVFFPGPRDPSIWERDWVREHWR